MHVRVYFNRDMEARKSAVDWDLMSVMAGESGGGSRGSRGIDQGRGWGGGWGVVLDFSDLRYGHEG